MSPVTEPENPDNQTVQGTTAPQNQPTPPAIPVLAYPFYAEFPVLFGFGSQPDNEAIKKKYQEWGIVGHNGLDFGLPSGTDVLACDDGVVTQVGDNGDFGISITIKHSWGSSIYCHLQSFGVLVNDIVTKAQAIGLSDATGFVTGPHLHFGMQPNNPDVNNGYLGYIDPSPYLSQHTDKPLPSPQPIQPEPVIQPQPVTPPIQPDVPVSPISPQPPQPSQEEIEKQATAMFDARRKENSVKGNDAKKKKREESISKIFSFAQEKKKITNEQVRDLLHISQSTATDYLSALVSRGMLKMEGKGKATVYLF
ncbi:M23 family metallopeptidase [Patescibacteria group bacterium]|nr:M23 family metallopeptidase [Patescibacteria group bacterium]